MGLHFHNKQHRVKRTSMPSQWRVLKRGCPQGSCFGPLLWNIYQNDLNYYFTDRNISRYADDYQVFVSGITLQNVTLHFKDQLQEVGDEIKLHGAIKICCRAILRSIKPSLLDQTKSTLTKILFLWPS